MTRFAFRPDSGNSLRKKFSSRTPLVLAATLMALSAGRVSQAAPNDYPQRPIKIVVPFTPGSATDVVARAIGEGLQKEFGQAVVVENRPGAGGTVGAGQVASAKPDGYTLLLHSAGHVANAAIYPNLRYDTVKDFKPIAMLATIPNVLVVSPDAGFKSAGDLVEAVRAKPGVMQYASAGKGSSTFMSAEKFRASTGFEALHVPYSGTPEATTATMSGQVHWFFAPITSALSMAQSKRLVPLAVSSPKRSSALPDVPTLVEAGFPGADYNFWVALFTPSRTPDEIVAKITDATAKALGSPEIQARLKSLGAEAPTTPPADFAALVMKEVQETGELIKSAKLGDN